MSTLTSRSVYDGERGKWRATEEGGRERLKSKAKLKTIETVNLFFTARHRIDGFSPSTDNQRRRRGQIELYYKMIVFLSAPASLMKQKMISDVRMRSRNMSRVSINLSQNLSPNMRHSVTGTGASGQRLLSEGSVNLTASSTGG